MQRAVPLLVWTLVLLLLEMVDASTRYCYCELRTGQGRFDPLMLEVEDPKITAQVVTCRHARLWCPSACYNAASARLLNGAAGGVAPLRGAAGETACRALRKDVSAEAPQEDVYAVYRVSNCNDSGYHYFGRLCCWKYLIGGEPIFKFNEDCKCGPAPDCEEATTTTEATTTSTTTSPPAAPGTGFQG